MKRTMTLFAAIVLPLGIGCTNFQVANLLNPNFLAEVTDTTSPASLPGQARSILVTFESRLNNPTQFTISYRTLNNEIPAPFSGSITPNSQLATAIACPILEITCGDITDLSAGGVFVGLAGQTDNDPFIAVEPFGILLREGVNYECGDGVTFVVLESQATASGYRVLAFVEEA